MSDSQSVKDYDVDEAFDPNIPDASNWSFDEVYNYFVQYFPEEAIVFKEQVSLSLYLFIPRFIYGKK